MKLWGLAGKAGSGKDTIADYLCAHHGWTRMAMADPLKAAAAQMFGIPLEHFYDRAMKEEVNAYWQRSPRDLLQVLGTEASKPHFGDNIWVRRWYLNYREIAESDNVVVTDIRFVDEAEKIRDLGGQVFEVVRPGAGLSGVHAKHASELGLPLDLVDGLIHNDGSIEGLHKTVELMLGRATS